MSNLRLAYQRLLKRSAIAAVSVKPWVQRLQTLAATSAGGTNTLQQLSRWHTQVRRWAGAKHGALQLPHALRRRKGYGPCVCFHSLHPVNPPAFPASVALARCSGVLPRPAGQSAAAHVRSLAPRIPRLGCRRLGRSRHA